MKPDITANQHRSRLYAGQSILEFAFLLPMLLLLIIGSMDLARLFTTKIVLTNAAREGANFLAQNPSDFGGTLTAINNELQNITLDESPSISCPIVNGECVKGETVMVSITKDVDLLFGNFVQAFGPIKLSSTVEMMVR
jgi:hypothetical protein